MDSSNDIPKELLSDSLAYNEIVLPYPDVIAAIHRLPQFGLRMIGWEGWLRFPDGRRGHSARHQGTVDLSDVSVEEATELCIRTITESHEEATRNPEAGELYFCLAVSAA